MDEPKEQTRENEGESERDRRLANVVLLAFFVILVGGGSGSPTPCLINARWTIAWRKAGATVRQSERRRADQRIMRHPHKTTAAPMMAQMSAP